MKILVTGGTGTVGSQVVRELLARGAEVSVLTRSQENAEKLPAGVTPIIGDLHSPATIKSSFDGFDGLFLLNPVSQTETNQGLMAMLGAVAAGIKKVVYLSVHFADVAGHLPHFGSKYAVENAIKNSGLDYVILRPNNYYQNDYWYKEAMQGWGVYPQPLGDAGVSRVDVRDIAELAAISFFTGEHNGKTFNLAGPDAVTGESTAAVWSEILGKEIKYGGNDMEAWEQQNLAYLPDWMVYDFKMMYIHFQNAGLTATEEDITKLTEALGHAPRSFRAFAEETAQMWK